MKKIISLALCAVLLMALLSGCNKKTGAGEVNVYNWGEYIDESIFADFEKETGIKVNYSNFQSNEDMYSVMKMGGSNYDVIIPSDYMISRLIEENLLEKVDFSNVPNFNLIDSSFKNLEYDPTNEFSVPYMWGTVGIIYNEALYDGEVTSWDALWDPELSGQILMFDNPRDAVGIALLRLGYSLNTTDESEIREAYDLLAEQKPLLQMYVMDQIYDKLESGEAIIGPYYCGDYVTMVENNPDLKFVYPSEGTNRFVDAMCIPKGAANKKNAELFINFMCKTAICARNMDVTGYASANTEAANAYKEDLEPELQEVVFPEESLLRTFEVFANLPKSVLTLYSDLWVELKS